MYPGTHTRALCAGRHPIYFPGNYVETEMPVDYYSLTDSQQKKLSEIRKSIKRHECIIETEKEVKEQAPDSYVVSRAKKSVSYHKTLLEKYEREYIIKIEEHKRAIEEAEDTLLQEQKRESRNIIIARNNIKKLQEELESLGLPQIQEITLTQSVEVSKPKELAISFQEFMASGFDEEAELARSREARGLPRPAHKGDVCVRPLDSFEAEQSEKIIEERQALPKWTGIKKSVKLALDYQQQSMGLNCK